MEAYKRGGKRSAAFKAAARVELKFLRSLLPVARPQLIFLRVPRAKRKGRHDNPAGGPCHSPDYTNMLYCPECRFGTLAWRLKDATRYYCSHCHTEFTAARLRELGVLSGKASK
jgi:hypothetical protein